MCCPAAICSGDEACLLPSAQVQLAPQAAVVPRKILIQRSAAHVQGCKVLSAQHICDTDQHVDRQSVMHDEATAPTECASHTRSLR